MVSMTVKHKWQFSSRFKQGAFGWRSDLPIKRIKEAVSEIKAISKTDSVLAAEGAVRFIERLSPAIEHVDSSSGSIGTAVNHAIEALAEIIGKAVVTDSQRNAWLERIWQAVQNDGCCYLDVIDEYWPMMCHTQEVGIHWADYFDELIVQFKANSKDRYDYFTGESLWYASLFAAERFEELLSLSRSEPRASWPLQRWCIYSLARLGRVDAAIDYARTQVSGISSDYLHSICEELLLKEGRRAEAYAHYALTGNHANSNLSKLRAIAKKYPEVAPEQILDDLVHNDPTQKGKWFAAAKSLGLYDKAIELVSQSPTDPATLIRAARDFADKQPEFAFRSGLAAVRWLLLGYGYEMTQWDLISALSLTQQIADANGYGREPIRQFLLALETEPQLKREWFDEVLKYSFR